MNGDLQQCIRKAGPGEVLGWLRATDGMMVFTCTTCGAHMYSHQFLNDEQFYHICRTHMDLCRDLIAADALLRTRGPDVHAPGLGAATPKPVDRDQGQGP